MNLDIYTIVFFAIAVVIFVRLYGVLGQKNGSERPPFPPVSPRDRVDNADAGNDNVVPLPNRPFATRESEAPIETPVAAEPESGLTAALRAIVSADRSFDPDRFLDGARIAYEMIVTAYAAGDRRALKTLVSKEVLDGFVRVIDDREKRGEKTDFTFVGMDRTEIVEAQVEKGTARLTVRFAAKVISATRDAGGTVVDGDPTKLVDLVDVWTFARPISSSDPNWRLVDTRAVA